MKVAARLLLVVALLLPLRGALAASGMLCHVGSLAPVAATQGHDAGAHEHPAVTTPHHHHHHGGGTAESSAQHVAHAAHDERSGDAGAAGGASTCDFCSSVCASPPLPSSHAQLPELRPATGERFPALAPRRPAPTQSGLERPPRSG